MLMTTVGASLLGNALASKGVIEAVEGNISDG